MRCGMRTVYSRRLVGCGGGREVVVDEVAQAEGANLRDFAKRDGNLLVAGMAQARGESGEDAVFLVLAGADHEREAEPLAVRLIELVEGGDLVRGEAVEAGGGLLAGGGGGEGSGAGSASHEIGMGAQQGDFAGFGRGV